MCVCLCSCVCVASDLGVKCDMYHAGMSNDRRTRVHYRFLRDELQVKLAHIVHVVALYMHMSMYLHRIELNRHFFRGMGGISLSECMGYSCLDTRFEVLCKFILLFTVRCGDHSVWHGY